MLDNNDNVKHSNHANKNKYVNTMFINDQIQTPLIKQMYA
jgi:hypothetical protein